MLYAITGASRGLGYRYVLELLKDSSNSVIAFCRNPSGATQLHELEASNKGRLEIVQLDVTDDNSVSKGIEQASKLAIAKDGIDVLVNNAGILLGGSDWKSAAETSVHDAKQEFETNVFGVIRVTQAALPLLRKSKGKKIIVIGSIVGSFGGPMGELEGLATYGSTKSAIHMWTRKLSITLAKEGFTVAPMHPGYVATEMNSGSDPETSGMISPEEAGIKGAALIQKLGPKDSGKLWSYTGDVLPW